MTVKELMEQVDADKVTEAFLLTFYLFYSHFIFFIIIVMNSLYRKSLMQFPKQEN